MKRLIAFLFLCANANAATIDPSWKQENINDFSAGLLTAPVPSKANQKGSTFMRNIWFDEVPGSLVSVNGCVVAGSTNTLTKITGQFPFKLENDSQELLLTDGSTLLSTRDFTTYTVIKTGLTSSANLSCKQIRNKMWCSNGVDSVFTYDASTVALLNGTNQGGNIGLTPNVPKGKYIEYYQERVWILNDPTDSSGLYYSAVSSTAGISIAPDDPLAWPATNKTSPGRGDGTSGSGLWVQNGTLVTGKEGSLYAILGNDEFTYKPVKIEGNIGLASNDSIAQQDSYTYWLGRDGIYKRSSGGTERISDAIAPDIETFIKDNSRIVSAQWDSQSQFVGKGSVSYSTATGGTATLQAKDYQFNYISAAQPSGAYLSFPSGGGTDFVALVPTVPVINANFTVYPIVAPFKMWARTSSCSVGHNRATIKVQLRNLRTGQKLDAGQSIDGFWTAQITNTDFAQITLTTILGNFFDDFTNADVIGSSLAIQVAELGNVNDGCGFDFYPATATGNSELFVRPNGSGQYLSEITTTTSLSAWNSLESNYSVNGGTIAFFVRASNSVANISTQSWTPITPGSVIGFPIGTSGFVQWASTLTQNYNTDPPAINNVNVRYYSGTGPINRAVAASWRNRYWLAVATETTGNFSLIYVKSKITNPSPDAWTVLQGCNIRSIAIFNGNLYGGSAIDGTVFRMDYGTNYDGEAIDSVYDTTDLILGSNFTDKTLKEILVDAERESGDTMSIGISLDRADYIYKTVSLDGTGRLLTSIYDVRALGKAYGKWLRLRIRHNTLDKPFQLNTISLFYTLEQSR